MGDLTADRTAIARDDLAFMRALAEDSGPLPFQFGANLFVPGLLFGATTVLAWSILIGAVGLPLSWMDWLWIPAVLIYLPAHLLIRRRHPAAGWGPGKRIFDAAWTAMGMMSVAVLVSLVMARGRIDAPFLLLWPPIAFALYGGTWAMVGLIRRRRWYGVLAAGCFVTAVACASLISTPRNIIGVVSWFRVVRGRSLELAMA